MGKLVLSRRPKERVLICVDHTVITVTVYETSSGSASLVFEAPPGVRILREELAAREPSPQLAAPERSHFP
jgi:sRNA-binding carbon storage regulator CsrA